MRTIKEVIVELSQASGMVDILSEGEKLRLLRRAHITIQEGWRFVGRPDRAKGSAETMDLIRAGEAPLRLHDDEMKAALREAIAVIRQIEQIMTENAERAEDKSSEG